MLDLPAHNCDGLQSIRLNKVIDYLGCIVGEVVQPVLFAAARTWTRWGLILSLPLRLARVEGLQVHHANASSSNHTNAEHPIVIQLHLTVRA